MTILTYDDCEEKIISLRQQLVSRDAEIERLKTVPMRYRRLAFNAKLQDENDQLRNLLRPFAALLQEHNRKGPDEQPIFQINDAKITRGDLRRALAATEPK